MANEQARNYMHNLLRSADFTNELRLQFKLHNKDAGAKTSHQKLTVYI